MCGELRKRSTRARPGKVETGFPSERATNQGLAGAGASLESAPAIVTNPLGIMMIVMVFCSAPTSVIICMRRGSRPAGFCIEHTTFVGAASLARDESLGERPQSLGILPSPGVPV